MDFLSKFTIENILLKGIQKINYVVVMSNEF